MIPQHYVEALNVFNRAAVIDRVAIMEIRDDTYMLGVISNTADGRHQFLPIATMLEPNVPVEPLEIEEEEDEDD